MMPDDQVTIDPEFRPSRPDGGDVHRFRAAGIAAVVVAAFVLGWFLRSPAPPEAEPDGADAAASVTSTTAAVETTTTSRARPSTTTTSEPGETIDLGVPLAETVPGFTDVITMERWSDTGVEIARWRGTQSRPQTIASFGNNSESPWFEDLDTSATWYTLRNEYGMLSVHHLEGGDPWLAQGWGQPDLHAVGVRVASSVWHDTEAGQLAWLTCSRMPGGPGTLFRLDVTDDAAEPIAIHRIDRACAEDSSVWLAAWGDWGYTFYRWEETGETLVLLDAEGVEIASVGDDLTESWFVAGGPDGTLWNDLSGAAQQSFLLSPDGRSRTPAPGLTEGEWLGGARWSPDGTRLALTVHRPLAESPIVRIVALPGGGTLAEFEEAGWVAGGTTWSSDGRFLLFDRWLCPDGCGFAGPEEWGIAFYDTQTDNATWISLPAPSGGDWWGNVRLTDPGTPAELVAHYPLDGNGTDLTGHGLDGAVIGPTRTSDRYGTPDAAYAFDGENDRIAIIMRPQLQSDVVSIAAWVKLPDPATPRPVAGWRDVVSYGGGGHVLAIHSDGVVLGGLGGTGADCEFAGSDTVFDGEWHHVAMTRDANWVIRVYLDGVAQTVTAPSRTGAGTGATTGAACTVGPEFDKPVWIGGDPDLWEFFRGSIDDVRIYTGALTDDEVAALAANTP
jgi:hypothetical protein